MIISGTWLRTMIFDAHCDCWLNFNDLMSSWNLIFRLTVGMNLRCENICHYITILNSITYYVTLLRDLTVKCKCIVSLNISTFYKSFYLSIECGLMLIEQNCRVVRGHQFFYLTWWIEGLLNERRRNGI